MHKTVFSSLFVLSVLLLAPMARGEMYALVAKDGSVTITDTRSDVRMRRYSPGDLERWAMRQQGVPHQPVVSQNFPQRRGQASSARNTRYDRLILAASVRHGVPFPLIKAVVAAESAFTPTVVSKAGAQGLMQLMPATALELGVTNPFDPEQNIDGGTRYLARLLKVFRSDKLVVAAYNAGPGRVRRAGGVPNIRETRAYVRKVLSLKKVYGGGR